MLQKRHIFCTNVIQNSTGMISFSIPDPVINNASKFSNCAASGKWPKTQSNLENSNSTAGELTVLAAFLNNVSKISLYMPKTACTFGTGVSASRTAIRIGDISKSADEDDDYGR